MINIYSFLFFSTSSSSSTSSTNSKTGRKPSDLELFSGFKNAIEACMLDWEDYPIPGVTFGHNSHYLTPFAVFKLNDSDQQASAQVINHFFTTFLQSWLDYIFMKILQFEIDQISNSSWCNLEVKGHLVVFFGTKEPPGCVIWY